VSEIELYFETLSLILLLGGFFSVAVAAWKIITCLKEECFQVLFS